MATLDAALARAEGLAARLEEAAAAADWLAALEQDTALAATLHDVAAELERADHEQRSAAAAVLRRVQSRHGSALRLLEAARDDARAELSGAVQGRRGAGAYLASAEE